MFNHIHHVFRRVNKGRDIAISRFGNGKAERPYHRTVLGRRNGKSYAFTEDGRRLTLKRFDEEVRRRAQRARAQAISPQQVSECEACIDDRTLTCQTNFGYFCIGAGIASLFAGPFAIPIGGGIIISCAIVELYGCTGAAQDSCAADGFC